MYNAIYSGLEPTTCFD